MPDTPQPVSKIIVPVEIWQVEYFDMFHINVAGFNVH